MAFWKKRASSAETVRTKQPSERLRSVIQVANLQGLGDRTEQQDAFGISLLSDYEQKGLLCVLCDGMGGMNAGREIAQLCVRRVMEGFALPADQMSNEEIEAMLLSLNRDIYAAHAGSGGATLVLVYVRDGKMRYCSMGDSDLFLIRAGEIYAVNEHQTYENRRMRESIETGLAEGGIFGSEQADALVGFLGCADPKVEQSRRPISLKKGDLLVLCSDGVSGTCTRREILNACEEDPEAAVAGIDARIREKQKANQDNYTAIICKFNG